jgi:hypothetical protein
MHYHLLLIPSLINNDLNHGIPAFVFSFSFSFSVSCLWLGAAVIFASSYTLWMPENQV